MLKYYDKAIVFQEVPDEISLAIDITNCPYKCKNCHSPHLRENIGTELTEEEIKKLCNTPLISCICLMGGDSDHNDIIRISKTIHRAGLKVAMYSGSENIDIRLVSHLDYYKIGPYIEEKGPLSNKNTNQIFYKINYNNLEDITYRFWK